jgi:cell wall-associated NlpC family hydrolase
MRWSGILGLGAWVCVVLAVPRVATAQGIQHVVQPGETLTQIASRYGTTVRAVAEANGLQDPDVLRVGQVLRIPTRSAPVRREASPGLVYEVRPGDTLWRIARQHGTTPERIASLNGISVEATLRIGQRLRIPTEAVVPPRRVAVTTSRGAVLAAIARRFLGVPYRWGGVGGNGFDCSGFIYAMFKQFGITLPRTSFEMFGVGRPVSTSDLRPGDLVFFTTYRPGPSHVGIYLGGGQFIHASSARGRVRVDTLLDGYYRARFIGARRHF